MKALKEPCIFFSIHRNGYGYFVMDFGIETRVIAVIGIEGQSFGSVLVYIIIDKLSESWILLVVDHRVSSSRIYTVARIMI